MVVVEFHPAEEVSPLYLAQVSPSCNPAPDAFGVVCVRGDDSGAWYMRYASDHTVPANTVRLPAWLAERFPGGGSVALESVKDNEFASMAVVELTPKPWLPLPCSLATAVELVKKQLLGQLVFPECILPVVLYGRHVFFGVQSLADSGLSIIDAGTKVHIVDSLACSDQESSLSGDLQLVQELKNHLLLLEKSHERPITRGGAIFAAPNVFILREINCDLVELSLRACGHPVLRPPIHLLLPQVELESSEDCEQRSQRTLEAWGQAAFDQDSLSVVYLGGIDYYSGDTVRRLSKLCSGPWRHHKCAFIMSVAAKEVSADLVKHFPQSITLHASAASQDAMLRSFRTDFMVEERKIPLQAAQQLVDAELRSHRPGSICSTLPKGLSSWAHLFGYEREKSRIRQLVYQAALPNDRLARFGIRMTKGILLHGPSGSGKSEMIKAIANDDILPVIQLRPTDILSKYLGESEERLRAAFGEARATKPCILFIDNIDILGARRGVSTSDTTGVSERLLSTLLNEMDGVEESTGLIVIGCTHHFEALDEALTRPGRLDHHIEIPAARRDDLPAILTGFFSKLHIAHTDSDDIVAQMSAKLEGQPVAQIKSTIYQFAHRHLNDPLPLPSQALLEAINSCFL